MSSPLDYQAHRPWPLPDAPWVMRQRWDALLFAHWPCPEALVRPLVPAGLEVEQYGGACWIGVVPFLMRDVRFRDVPPIPTARVFPELNVRTYVRHGDKSGVWFFSLDADSPLAVFGARLGAHLPYYRARMRMSRVNGRVHYSSTRRGGARAAFVASYGPAGPVLQERANAFDRWLTERYCLYSASSDRRRLWRLDIHHQPWSLQPATAAFPVNTMPRAAGLSPDPVHPVLHFSARQDVLAWWPVRVQ